MKNKKGFTLVELLSVIVLLGIIITIGIFSVSSIRKTILDRQYKNLKTEIEIAAEKYYSDTESTEVYVDTLIKEGYLKADNKSMTITDPRDKTSLNCHIVTINDNEEGNLGIESNIDENGNCNEEAIVNSEISIVDIDGNKINKTWYKGPITLKVKFNKAKYAFDCSAIGLTSLEGCPKEVGGQFTCEDNELVSLEGGPKTAGSYNCEFNKLTSLKGAPEKVKYDFNCSNNKTLESLEGCPKEVGGTFSIAISAYEKPFTSEEIAKLCKVGEDIIV